MTDLIKEAAAAPVKRPTRAERRKAVDELRGKGYTWQEIADWFKEQGYSGVTAVALKVAYSRAKARTNQAAPA